MDEIDRAQAREQQMRDDALDAHRRRLMEPPRMLGGQRVCTSCAERIDRRRLKAVPFATRCAPCQEIHEKRLAQIERTR